MKMNRDDLIAHLRFARKNMCLNCTYDDILDQAIEMIKGQEPVKPYTKRDGRTTFFLCGGCNEPLCIAKDSYKPKHCPECGREVKWE